MLERVEISNVGFREVLDLLFFHLSFYHALLSDCWVFQRKIGQCFALCYSASYYSFQYLLVVALVLFVKGRTVAPRYLEKLLDVFYGAGWPICLSQTFLASVVLFGG